MVQKLASPFGGYYIYPDDPNNLFQQLLGAKPGAQHESTSELTPAVDIYEDNSAYYASIEMPGVGKENLKISFLMERSQSTRMLIGCRMSRDTGYNMSEELVLMSVAFGSALTFKLTRFQPLTKTASWN
jgi:hypothetical protein